MEKLKSYIKNGKIAYVMDLGDYLGGAGNHLLRHACLCKNFGFDTIVIIPISKDKKENTIERICMKNGLDYIYANYKTASDFSFIDGDLIETSVSEFISLVSQYNIKIFHSVQLNPSVEIAARVVKIPHIMSIYQIEEDSFDLTYPDVFAKFIHSDSILYANIWQKGLNGKSVCIRSYIPDEFREHSLKEIYELNNKKEFNCIVSGTVCERKSQHIIIECLGKLKIKGIKVNVKFLGYADQGSAYFKLCNDICRRCGLEEQVIFTGFTENVVNEMSNADFLICASKSESFPQAILESMAMNIPVITTPVAGVPELIKDCETGYLTNGFGVDDLVEAVEKYIFDYNNNINCIEHIVCEAKRMYEKECSKDSVSKKLFKFYNEAILNIYDYNNEQVEIRYILKDYEDFNMRDFIRKISLILTKEQVKFILNNKFGIVYKLNFLKKMYGEKNINCYIWGAGTAGLITLEILKLKLVNFKVIGFIDKFKSGECNGTKIYKPEDVSYNEDIYIFIATGPGKASAADFLENQGKNINKDFISIIV